MKTLLRIVVFLAAFCLLVSPSWRVAEMLLPGTYPKPTPDRLLPSWFGPPINSSLIFTQASDPNLTW